MRYSYFGALMSSYVCFYAVFACLMCVFVCSVCELVCCVCCLLCVFVCCVNCTSFVQCVSCPELHCKWKLKSCSGWVVAHDSCGLKAGYLFCKSFYKIVCAGYSHKICKLVRSVYLLDKCNDQTLAQRNRQLCGQTVHLNDNITLNVLDTRCSGFDRNLADKISAVLVVWLAWLGLKDCED